MVIAIVIVIVTSHTTRHAHINAHPPAAPAVSHTGARLQNALAEENQLLSGAESQQAEVRVAFGEPAADQQPAASDDQQVAAQTNAASIDEITLDDADSSEENRNKRSVKHCPI